MKIDKDIPIPKSKKGFQLKYEELHETIGKMEIGDSFLVPGNAMKKGYLGNPQYFKQKFNIKLTQRKTAEGVRVWRIA